MSRSLIRFIPSIDNYLVRVIEPIEASNLYPQFKWTAKIESVDVPGKSYVFSLVEVVATYHDNDEGYEPNDKNYDIGDILFTNLTSCPKISLGGREYFIVDAFDIQGMLDSGEDDYV